MIWMWYGAVIGSLQIERNTVVWHVQDDYIESRQQ